MKLNQMAKFGKILERFSRVLKQILLWTTYYRNYPMKYGLKAFTQEFKSCNIHRLQQQNAI